MWPIIRRVPQVPAAVIQSKRDPERRACRPTSQGSTPGGQSVFAKGCLGDRAAERPGRRWRRWAELHPGSRARLCDLPGRARCAAQLVGLCQPFGDGRLHLVPVADGNRAQQLGLRHPASPRGTITGTAASVARKLERTG